MSKKTFLVTGASGFMGYHTCKGLLDRGHTVRGLDIHNFNYPDLENNVEFFKGDIRDGEILEEVMEDVDIVIHGAAALPLWSKKEIFSTNVDGTRKILKTALDHDVEKVVYISSTSVYGIPEHHPVDENYPLKGVGPYGESKVKAENVCQEFRGKGLCVPVLRPKTFAGPKRLGVFQILCDWVMERKNIPIIGKGDNKYQLLHIDDLVDAIYTASVAPEEKANDVFNVGATEFGTLREDLQKLLVHAGTGKKVIPTPSSVVIPILKAFHEAGMSPLYRWVYETADVDHYVAVDKIQEVLGCEPEKSTAEVWIDTYDWYVKNFQDYKEESAGTTHRKPWKQGVLELVKAFF